MRGQELHWGGAFGWIIPLALWSAIWTGFALWHAAKRGQLWWFIFFMVFHTAGIIELVYLLFVIRAFNSQSTRSRQRKKRTYA